MRASARIGNTMYVAGDFKNAFLVTEGHATVSRATGFWDRTAPATAFNVGISDGANGIYVSRPNGTFHEDANGVVDPAFQVPYATSQLRLQGGRLYAMADTGIQSLDPVTGAAILINPSFTRRVTINGVTSDQPSFATSYAVIGDRLFAVGPFDKVSGAPRVGVAAFDIQNGFSLLPWTVDPAVDPSALGGLAEASPTRLFIGASSKLWAVDPLTGLPVFTHVAGVNPVKMLFHDGRLWYLSSSLGARSFQILDGDGAVAGSDPTNGGVYDFSGFGNTMYLVGGFNQVLGQNRANLAAISTGGSLQSWAPRSITAPTAVLAGPTNVYLETAELEAAPRQNAFAFDMAANVILPWAPNPNNVVTGMTLRNGRIWMAGNFSAIGSPRVPRNNVAVVSASDASIALPDVLGVEIGDDVFDLVDAAPGVIVGKILQMRGWTDAGVLLPKVPPVNGIRRVGVYGPNLYVSGNFSNFGGVPRTGNAAVNLSTGAVLGWQVSGGQQFNDVEGGSTGVFLAGYFSSINGVSRSLLALVDGATAIPLGFDAQLASPPGLIPFVNSVSVSDGRVYACGDFRTASGQPRRNIAAFDETSGALDDWAPPLLGYLGDPGICNYVKAYSDWVLTGGVACSADSGSSRYLCLLPSALATAGTVDTRVSMTGAPDPVAPGDLVTFTATVTNAGPDPTQSAAYTDSLPAGAALISAVASQGTCSGTSSLSCGLGPLASGASATVTVVVRALQSGTLTNSATVSSFGTDPDSTNNSVSTSVVVSSGPVSDVSVLTTAGSAPQTVVGTPVDFVATVRNLSAQAAAGVVVDLTIPANVTVGTVTTTLGTCAGSQCTLGTLTPGATATITVSATAAQLGLAAFNAVVYFPGSDSSPGNNFSAAQTTIVSPGADLSVFLSDSPDPVPQGASIAYTASITNFGPSTATNASLSDVIPAGLTATSATSMGGSCTLGATVNCALGNIPPGTTVTATIVAQTSAQGSVTNSVSVLSALPDADQNNNAATATTTVGPPPPAFSELSVTLAGSPDPVGIGEPLTFTSVLANAGPDDAVATTATYDLPAGAALVSVTTTVGTCTGTGPITCALGNMLKNSQGLVTIVVTIPAPGAATCTASIQSAAADQNPTDNTASVTIAVVQGADLVVSKLDSRDPVGLGETLDYVIRVTNKGPIDATGVSLTDALPAGLTFVSASASQGTCTGGATVNCALLDLPRGAFADVTIRVTATASGLITNTATASAIELDPVAANSSASATTRVGSLPELRLTKSHTGNFTAGANGTFTLTLANQGTAANGFSGAPIQIASIANVRFGNDWTLDGLNMQKTRAKLLSTSNFGAGGTVPRPVAISDVFAAKGSISKAALSGYDALFIGYFNDGSANTFTAAELLAMKEWVTDGGSILVSCDNFDHDNVCNAFGYPALATLDIANPMTPTALGAAHPAFSGPFGPVASFSGYQTIGFFYTSVGADVLARDPNGTPVVLEKAYGQGKVVFLSDVDFISTAATSGPGISSGNDRLLANLFAHAGRAGTIHVGDTLPAGLSFVSAAGTGWNCSGQGQTVGCNFTGALAPGASSTITVTTAVAPGATGSLTNRAVMSAYGDTEPSNNVAIDTVSLAGGAAVPSVNLVVPAKGPTAGGTAVTIYGSNFDAGAAVRFAGNPATGVTIVNATTITATTPAGPQGPVDVSVTNPSTTSFSRPSAFLYEAPVVPTQLYTLVPCRLVDTRGAVGPYGGPALSANQTRTFALSGSCGIPADAVALSLNLTVLNATTGGEIVLAPAGISTPGTSASSFRAGSTRANNTLMPVNGQPLGSLAVTAKIPSGTVEVVIDVNGYFR